MRAAGLDDRVEVVMEDYRDLRGSYSKLVSIESLIWARSAARITKGRKIHRLK